MCDVNDLEYRVRTTQDKAVQGSPSSARRKGLVNRGIIER